MSENKIPLTTLLVDSESLPPSKVPSKSEGVPREGRGGTFVAELARALSGLVSPAAVVSAAETRGFYEAELMKQWRMLAEIAVELCGHDALHPLEQANDARVRGIAPMVVRLLYLDDLPVVVNHLKRQSALPGTSVQEGAQMTLKLVFLEHGLETTLALVRNWTSDPQAEVRRCLVEALRPRGVWTAYLPDLRRDPAPLAPILEELLDDPSLYVRKALANCLNDVGKDNPLVLLTWARNWAGGSTGRQWALARGLRGLVKAGNPEALQYLGLAEPQLLTSRWRNDLPVDITINQYLIVEVEIDNSGDDPARVLVQATLSGPGRGKSPRVRRYRIAGGVVPAASSELLTGRIHFVDFNSQRKLGGEYELTIDVNGCVIGSQTFRYTA